MTFQSGAEARADPIPESQSDQPKLSPENVIKAFGPLVVAWFLDQARRGEETEPEPEPTPHDRLALLRLQHEVSSGSAAPGEQEQKEPPPPAASSERDFREIAEGLRLDINSPATRVAFLAALSHYRNSEYVWGGTGRGFKGVDCSGLIMAVLCDQLGIAKGDASAERLYKNMTNPLSDPDQLQPGDLVFWKPRKLRAGREITHVAVVAQNLGGGRVRLIESSGGVGYHEDRIVDLGKGTKNSTFVFGSPIYFDPKLKDRFEEEVVAV